MRVTDMMQSDFWQNSINNSLSNLNTVQQEISTGKSINEPSDNPAGAAQAMAISAQIVANTQYQGNVTSAQSELNTQSSALSTVSNLLDTAQQIASSGASSTNDSTSYAALIQQIGALTTQMVNVANTTDGNGNYVFSGTATSTPPYTQYPQPSTTPTLVDDNSTPSNFTAGTYYVSYSYTYASGGVSPASTPAQVTLASSGDSIDVNGVPSLPSGATGVNVYVGTSATNMTLAQNFASTSPITVTTAPVGGAASAPTTATAPVYAGNSGTMTTSIGPNATVQTNTPGNSIFNPIFSALQQITTDLQNASANPPVSGAITSLSNDIGLVQSAAQTVSTTSAEVGSKLDMLQTTSTDLTNQATQYQQSLSNVQDVDLATAYVQLQSNENVYQASLDATSKAYQYTLVDFLSS